MNPNAALKPLNGLDEAYRRIDGFLVGYASQDPADALGANDVRPLKCV